MHDLWNISVVYIRLLESLYPDAQELYSKPWALSPILYILNPKPQTLDSKPYTLNPKP